MPKAIIPTSYGYTEDFGNGQDVTMADADKEATENGGDATADANVNAPSNSKKVKMYVGQHGPSMFRPNMNVGNPMSGGLSMSYIYLLC